MTIAQIECFVEAVKAGSFSKAAVNLFVGQSTISRQVKALEEELGFPLLERRNSGIALTKMGTVLFSGWEEMLLQHRVMIDKAKDMYHDSQKKVRIGVQEFGKLNDKIRDALFCFAQLSEGLEVDYDILPSNQLLRGIETGDLHIIIIHASELVKNPNLRALYMDKLSMQTGIVVSRYHPLARHKNLSIQDLKGETLAVMGNAISVDYKDRILAMLKQEQMQDQLKMKEYNSWSKMEFDLLSGKCVGILYSTHMLGLEDRLAFYPIQMSDDDVENVAVAWKNEEYFIKAKNIADML